MAFNLTRAAATITGPDLAKATTPTIWRKLIAVPARIATSARRATLHLPTAWPWETAWTELFTASAGTRARHGLTTQAESRERTTGNPGTEAGRRPTPHPTLGSPITNSQDQPSGSVDRG